MANFFLAFLLKSVSIARCTPRKTIYPPREVSMKEDRIAFLLMFCGMILVKRHKATMEETMSILPLYGGARVLAGEMAANAPQ